MSDLCLDEVKLHQQPSLPCGSVDKNPPISCMKCNHGILSILSGACPTNACMFRDVFEAIRKQILRDIQSEKRSLEKTQYDSLFDVYDVLSFRCDDICTFLGTMQSVIESLLGETVPWEVRYNELVLNPSARTPSLLHKQRFVKSQRIRLEKICNLANRWYIVLSSMKKRVIQLNGGERFDVEKATTPEVLDLIAEWKQLRVDTWRNLVTPMAEQVEAFWESNFVMHTDMREKCVSSSSDIDESIECKNIQE